MGVNAFAALTSQIPEGIIDAYTLPAHRRKSVPVCSVAVHCPRIHIFSACPYPPINYFIRSY
jgi:hypothetical protein